MALPSPVVVAAGGEPGGAARLRFEVADVVRACGQEYLRTHPTSVEQRKVLRAIAACRTAALGGHVDQCDGCSYRRITYNSCRNRHCPKCQGKERADAQAQPPPPVSVPRQGSVQRISRQIHRRP
jgi:hypothetical protein